MPATYATSDRTFSELRRINVKIHREIIRMASALL
jgi:hypothetical protein